MVIKFENNIKLIFGQMKLILASDGIILCWNWKARGGGLVLYKSPNPDTNVFLYYKKQYIFRPKSEKLNAILSEELKIWKL